MDVNKQTGLMPCNDSCYKSCIKVWKEVLERVSGDVEKLLHQLRGKRVSSWVSWLLRVGRNTYKSRTSYTFHAPYSIIKKSFECNFVIFNFGLILIYTIEYSRSTKYSKFRTLLFERPVHDYFLYISSLK